LANSRLAGLVIGAFFLLQTLFRYCISASCHLRCSTSWRFLQPLTHLFAIVRSYGSYRMLMTLKISTRNCRRIHLEFSRNIWARSLVNCGTQVATRNSDVRSSDSVKTIEWEQALGNLLVQNTNLFYLIFYWPPTIARPGVTQLKKRSRCG